MNATPTESLDRVQQRLDGQTVVVLGGSAGIGLATAQLARAAGADVVITGRDRGRLTEAAAQVETAGTSAFDATDSAALASFFDGLDTPIDHVLVTGAGPSYAPLMEIDFEEAARDVAAHLWLPIHVARNAIGRVRPGGSLAFIGGTGARRPAPGLAVVTVLTAAMPALAAEPRARDRPGARQPDRRRIRRHSALGQDPGR